MNTYKQFVKRSCITYSSFAMVIFKTNFLLFYKYHVCQFRFNTGLKCRGKKQA